jgi:hypothetical protein
VKVPRGYPKVANQLFTMDSDGANVEKIGHINIGSALHPVILKDGRIIPSANVIWAAGVTGNLFEGFGADKLGRAARLLDERRR